MNHILEKAYFLKKCFILVYMKTALQDMDNANTYCYEFTLHYNRIRNIDVSHGEIIILDRTYRIPKIPKANDIVQLIREHLK